MSDWGVRIQNYAAKAHLKERGRTALRWLLIALPVVVSYAVFGCPIKYVTGISCPGCGISRAALSLCRLDWHRAWEYHPLVYFTPLAVLWFLFRKKAIVEKLEKLLLICVVVLFVVVYIYRMIWGNGAVIGIAAPQILYDISENILIWR